MIEKKAFTLAEVLITLTIIGVVAALTIPTLMKSVEQQQYLTALKKAYTTANQAIIQMTADYNCTGDLSCTGIFGSDRDATFNTFVSYFKTSKVCGTSATEKCWADSFWDTYDGSGTTWYAPNTWGASNYYNFITVDGMSYSFISMANNCTSSATADTTNPFSKWCGAFFLDINGLKPPNRLGRDVFRFYITNGKGPLILPYGSSLHPTNYWNGATKGCQSGTPTGNACGGRIMEEGWQMNY